MQTYSITPTQMKAYKLLKAEGWSKKLIAKQLGICYTKLVEATKRKE
jgi:hypothetical protein